MTTTFPDRVREHEAPHLRHTDVQTLDALLRIEELLINLNERFCSQREVTVDPEFDLEAAMENITPKETPLTKTVAKRKNTRQL